MKFFDQIAEYLYLKKDKSGQPRSTWTKMMHGMNRISIFVFLFAIIVVIVRNCTRH